MRVILAALSACALSVCFVGAARADSHTEYRNERGETIIVDQDDHGYRVHAEGDAHIRDYGDSDFNWIHDYGLDHGESLRDECISCGANTDDDANNSSDDDNQGADDDSGGDDDSGADDNDHHHGDDQ